MRFIAMQQDVPSAVARNAIHRLLEADRTSEPLAEVVRQEYRALPSVVSISFSPSAPSLLS